jgi:tetratricopeptide (TPR) repeat protein
MTRVPGASLPPENTLAFDGKHFTTERLHGNEAFRSGNYQEAIDHYSAAINAANSRQTGENSEANSVHAFEQAVVWCNRAATYLKLAEKAKEQVPETREPERDEKGSQETSASAPWTELFLAAVEDSSTALELLDSIAGESRNERNTELKIKALHRRMRANTELGKYSEAAKDADALAALRPEYHSEARRLAREATAANEREKQEAMQKLKEVGNSFLSLFGMSLENFQTTRNPDGTFSVSYAPKG